MSAALDAPEVTSGSVSRYVAPRTAGQLRVLRIGDVELHLDSYRLIVRGDPVDLPQKEFRLLAHLMNNAGRAVPRRELLDHAWGPGTTKTRNYLEVHVRRIRQKIGDGKIRTVRGIGYIFDFPMNDLRVTSAHQGSPVRNLG